MESSHPRAGRKSRKLGSRRRHQMKEVADEDGPPVLDSEQWPSQATEELQDFFRECGAEHKGFITREDLRKAKFSFLGNREELELIFEWLDPERKGSLTIKEFTSGLKNVFSSQTRIPGSRKRKPRTWVFSKEEPTSFQPLEEVDPEERRWFLSFMEQLGTDHLLLDQAEIWQLWKKLRQEEPHLVGNLEGFLAKVTSRLQETRAEKETLQMTLKKYDDDHHREVRQLYEEMEHQIHSEKQRLQAASNTQGLAYSSMMHQALKAKEQEMQHLAEGQRELEAQINLLKSKRHEVSIENQRLQETQRDLTGQLEQVQGQLQVTRGHLNLARGQVAWQVEEETSLSSDPPMDPKNTSDSQHFTSLPEEDPLPSLFEEGDWNQLLSNFTSPLPGNTTQISWNPPPTPTSLKGYHTPRIVRQISITKRNSWQLNQESPSDPEVLPRNPLGSSEAPAVVPELNVAGELEPGKTFQWDFQRVSSGEPATTTWGQAAPELGDFLASSDSLPSQDLAGSGKGFGETDGDEVGQGDGPISDLLSRGPSSEESLQTLSPSADMQADTWKVGAKEILHPGLPPAVSEQEVGSWGKEVFTLGPDVPLESPELVLIQESIPMREKEREKMNTEGWEIEINQQNDACGQEAELRESAGSVVSEVPGEKSKSTESPGPDVDEVPGEDSRSAESPGPDGDEILGEGYRITESPGPDVGEVTGEESRSAELPGPDVDEILGEGYRITESPGPDVDEVPGEDSRSAESPGPDGDEILGEGYRITESPGPDVDEVPGEDSRSAESPGPDGDEILGEGYRITESPGPDVDEVPGEDSRSAESPGPDGDEILGEGYRITESPGPDVDEVPGEDSRSAESPGPDEGEVPGDDSRFTKSLGPDVENALSQKAGLTDLPGPEIGNPDAQETSHVEPPRTVVNSVLNQEEQILRSFESDVEKVPGQKSQLIHSVRVIELPGTVMGNATEKKSELIMSPLEDTDNAFGQKTVVLKLARGDIGNVLCEEAGTLESAELGRDNHPGQQIGLLSSPSLDVDIYPSYEARPSFHPGVGDTTELHRLIIRNASDHEARFRISPEIDTSSQETGLTGSPGPDEDDVSSHGTRFMELWKIDIKNASGKEAQVLYSPEPEVGETFRQENVFMSSLGPDRADVTGQKAGTDIGDAAIQDARITELYKDNVRNASDQGSGLMESPELHVDDTVSQENGFIQSDKTDMENISGQEVEILYSPGLDSSDAPGQGGGYIESPGSDVIDVAVQEAGLMNSSVIDSADFPSQEDKLLLPEKDISLSATQESDVESGLDVGNAPSQETRHDIGGTFLYSPGPDIGDALSQETRLTEPTRMDVDDATVQRPGVIELFKADVGNVSDQENRLIKSSKTDAPIGKTELVELSGPEMGDNPGQEVKFVGLCEMDMGDVDMAEIRYSPVPDMHDSPGQKSRVVEVHGLCVSESPIQARVVESDVRDGPGQEVMTRESHEVDVGNASAQAPEIMHSPRPGVRDSAGPEAETVQSPGPYVGDSIGQEVGVPELDVGNAPDQEARFMPSSETHVSDACGEEAEILHSPGPDEEDSLGQGGEPKESSMLGLGGAPGQEGSFLELSEAGVDIGSSQQTRETGSPGPTVNDALDQEAGIRESYETDGRDALGDEVEFGPDVGDAATNEGILILKTQQSNVSDAFNSGQVVELIESCGPEVGDISHQEAEIMNSPGSDRCDAFHQETMFMELSETDVGNAEITYSLVPDMSESLGQEVMTRESHEVDVGNASAQAPEIMHSPRPGVRDSAGPEAETVQSPGPYVGDSIGQEAGVPELDVGNAPDQEARFMPSSETHVSDACGEEAEILHSPGPDGEDSLGQGGEPKESSMLGLEGAPGQEAGIRESYETDLRDALGDEVEFGPDVGDAATNEGILILKTQQSNVSDAFNSGQVVELIESCGSEVGDISHQEAEIMNSPGSDRCDAFYQEAKFRGLGETVVGDAEMAEILYSAVPDVNDFPDQESGVVELRGLYVSEISIQQARVLESDVRDYAGQGIMTRESHEADVGNASPQDTEIMHSPRPGVRDSAGPEAETAQSPGPDVGDSIGQEAGVPELDVGNAPDQEARFMPSSETHVSDIASQGSRNRELCMVLGEDVPDREAEILHSPGPDEEDSLGQGGEPKESSMLDLGGAPGQEGSFLELSEAGVDIGSSQQTRETGSPGPTVNDALDQEAGIRESYETDLRDALGDEVEFGPDVGDAATNEGILILKTQQSNVSDAFNSGQVVELIESCGPEVGDISHQEAEIMNSPGSDRCDAFHQETMFMELSETDVGNAEITYSLVPDMSESLGQEVMTRESHEVDVGNASAQAPEIMHSPRPGVRDSAGPEAETAQSPGPYVGDSIDQEAGVPELDVGNAPDQEARFMPSSETHVSDACGEEAEILHSPGPDGEDSLGQGGEPKESSMLGLEGAPGQEGSFLELSEAGVEDVFNHQVEQKESHGSDVRDILGQEAEFKKSCERDEEDTLELIQPTVLEETTSQEGSFLESPEEGVENGSRQQTGQIGSPGPDVEDAPAQEAEIRESYETDGRDALDKEGEFGPDVGDVAAGQGTLMPGTQEPDVGDASRIHRTTGLIQLYGPEVGDISQQEAEIMNSPGSDRCDAFHQETMFMELSETDVGNAEITYSLVPDLSESLGQEVMTRESHEADVENASAQATEIMHSPRPGVRDSAGPEAETAQSPGPYVGDSIGQEAGVPELDVGNAPDPEARFMPSSETHVSDIASQGSRNRELCMVLGEDVPDREAEILHLPGPDGEDSPGQEAVLSASPVQVLEGAPIQESRFLEFSEAGVHDRSCKQAGHPGSPVPGVRDTPVKETEILHTPNRVMSDYPHQGTDSLIDSFRPVIDILSDEEVQLPESAGPRVGDAPEEKPGNVESPRPDVLPVVPEGGGLQDQNSEAVWRAEVGVLQRQAQEGFLLPKDSSGDALGPQDSGQALSVPVEAEAQPECRVPGGQTIPLPEPREENSSEVMKKANLKSQVQATGVSLGGEAPEPDYLFHVLFLGDSNVGKTSFLHLLHHDSFATGLTATVGMDYRIKNLVVDDRRFALQLWDTAGQERYHSITKQFLRKADGIVLMYDVTCPGSFTHVRYWLDCIQESGPNDVVILLLGNKIDCVKERLVSTEVGQLLAKEIGVIFGECSAVLGHNILEPIVTLARAMQEQDTKLKHSVVKLEKKEEKKAGCCS